jgi:hypothetical protein
MIVRTRGLALAALAACLLPAGGRAAIPVAIYPPRGVGVSAESLFDVQSVLESALRAAAGRGVFVPASPTTLQATCPTPVAAGCLARLAGDGGVLFTSVRRVEGMLSVTVLLVDAAGTLSKGGTFLRDPTIQGGAPAQQVLATLEKLVLERRVSRATPTSTPAPTSTPPPTPTPAPLSTSTPDLHASPAPAALRRAGSMRDPTSPARSPWQLQTAKWTAVGGLGLLALGGGVGYLDKRLSDDLTRDHQRNALTPSDRARYDRVRTYNLAANALLIAGGAALVTAGVFWVAAPEPADPRGHRNPARFGVQGGF